MSRESSRGSNNFVKLSEFRYPQGLSSKSSLVYPQIPLSTVRQKMSSMGQIDQLPAAEESKMLQIPETMKLGELRRNNSAGTTAYKTGRTDYKKFIKPRDLDYRPELLIFGRYSYENYTNYAYKNPFRPPAPNIISGQQKPKRKQPFNYSPNLEAIYYRSRYQDFNELVQQKCKQSNADNELKRTQSMKVTRMSSRKDKFKNKLNLFIEQTANSNKNYRVKMGSSSLAHLIKQFNILHKLTQMIENQMKNSQNPLAVNTKLKPTETTSQEIYLEVLVHRFSWLKKLARRVLERLFAALGITSLDRYTKIMLSTYVQFIKIFVVRDATLKNLSDFLYKFFFGKSQLVTQNAFVELLDEMDGPQSKHNKILEIYERFFDDPVKSQGFRTFSEKNAFAMHYIIDLLIAPS